MVILNFISKKRTLAKLITRIIKFPFTLDLVSLVYAKQKGNDTGCFTLTYAHVTYLL
jgi:hypothetical protein